LEQGVYLKEILSLEVRNRIARAKYIPEDRIDEIDKINEELVASIDNLISKGGLLDA